LTIRLLISFISLIIGLQVCGQRYTTKPPKQNEKLPVQLDSTFTSPTGTLTSTLTDSIKIDSIAAAQPQLPEINISPDALDESITYDAEDSIIYDIVNEKIYLYGDAKVIKGKIELYAEYIIFDYLKQIVSAEGKKDSLGNWVGQPFFKEGEESFGAESMSYNFKSKKGKLSQVVTQEGEGYIRSEQVRKNEYDEMFGRHTYYTTCNHEHPHFRIESEKVKIIPNELIVTGPAKLFIDDVPTPLILPFGIFPLTEGRRSGIILPSYGRSPGLGFYLIGGGFYFGMNDYVDLAIKGDIYTRGSWKLNLLSSYKKKYKYNGRFNINFGKINNGDVIAKDFATNREFKIYWTHNEDPKAHPNSSFNASVNLGTSSYARSFTTNSNDYLANTLASSISYSNNLPRTPFNFTAAFRHSQNTGNRSVSVTLPELNVNMQRIYPFKRKVKKGKTQWFEKIGMTYRGNLKNSVEIADSLFFKKQVFDEIQNGIKHSIPINTSFNLLKYITVSPNFNYDEFWYTKSTEKTWDPTYLYDTISVQLYDSTITDNDSMVYEIETIYGSVNERIVSGFKSARQFNLSLSTNTRLYGILQFKKGAIRAIRHVARPSLSYNFRPNFGSDKFGYYKTVQTSEDGSFVDYSIFEDQIYSGPSRGKSSSLVFSLDNNFEMKVKSRKDTSQQLKKVKILESLNFRTSYNFAADSLKMADISVTARATILNKIKLNYSSSFSPYTVNNNGSKVDKFQWGENKSLARLTRMNVGINTSLSSKKKGNNNVSTRGTAEEREDVLNNLDSFIDFKIPWKISLGYNLNITRSFSSGEADDNITQTLNATLDMNITPKWKVNIRSGYDFVRKDLAFTTIDLYRDLHCWNMSFNWVPNGNARRYEFVIRANSSMLQDLKLQRRRNWYDF